MLPGRFEIDEYRIMERFSLGMENDAIRDELLQAIGGRGAFRRLREVILAASRRPGTPTARKKGSSQLLEESHEFIAQRTGIPVKGKLMIDEPLVSPNQALGLWVLQKIGAKGASQRSPELAVMISDLLVRSFDRWWS